MADAGLYIHVPFCAKRCPYCAFVLIESDGSLHERYVRAVERHMEATARELGRLRAVSVYFGGGTPSMLEPAAILRLVATARERFEVALDAEVTLEANPDGLSAEKLRAFRDAGVTRLSLGLQSLRDDELRFLGRTHSGAQAARCVEDARAAGFGNVSVDAIFGLPGQTLEAWRETLKRFVGLGPEHVSLYGLTVEGGTELERAVKRGATQVSDDAQKPLYEEAMEFLPSRGYRQYEISNFARPGWESRHNSGYWEGRPYVGFGPGAHSYIPHRRWASIANVREYVERALRGEDVTGMREELTREQRMLERVFLGLRRAEGLSAGEWAAEFGEGLESRYGGPIADLVSLGFLERLGDRLRLTSRGRLVADAVVGRFA